MEAPDNGHQYKSTDEIAPGDVNDWWREVMSQVPMVGFLRGGTVRCFPGSADIIVAPFAICLDEDGIEVLVVGTETTLSPGVLTALTQYYVYLTVVAGVHSVSVDDVAPDLARMFKTGDVTQRYLAAFKTDAGGVPRPFATDPSALQEGMVGYLRGGTIRFNASNQICIAPFVLTMPTSDVRGFATHTQRTEIAGGVPTHVANTRYYVYYDATPTITINTTAPDAAKVFMTGDESKRYFGTYLCDAAGDIAPFNDAPVSPRVFVGRLEGGDIRSAGGTDLLIAPFKASILIASTGVVEFAETFIENTISPSFTDEWHYVYLTISGGVSSVAANTTAPDAALRFKTGDTDSLYLGCYRGDGSGIIAFRKNGRVYSITQDVTDLIADGGGSGQVTSYTAVSLVKRVPPTSRLARLRLNITAGATSAYGSVGVRTTGKTNALMFIQTHSTVAGNANIFTEADVETNSSQQVDYNTVQSVATMTAALAVRGFVEAGDL